VRDYELRSPSTTVARAKVKNHAGQYTCDADRKMYVWLINIALHQFYFLLVDIVARYYPRAKIIIIFKLSTMTALRYLFNSSVAKT
jgi:hypothetical protein